MEESVTGVHRSDEVAKFRALVEFTFYLQHVPFCILNCNFCLVILFGSHWFHYKICQ